jgi:TolA-binding protein
MRSLAILFAIALFSAVQARGATAVRMTCGDATEYARAVCLYQRGELQEAEPIFAAIVERGDEEPATLKSDYFLARCQMARGDFASASAGLIKIYSLDPGFYHEWGCDYLLGECRKALGLG